ncbi:MAG: hypothetical protein KF772_04245 [Cryobacterium sp.]|nr:hypothetical protein [Cryobacterium sp.]
MNREDAFDLVLRRALRTDKSPYHAEGGEAGFWVERDPFFEALRAVASFLEGDFEATVRHARSAIANAADPDAVALARAAAGLGVAGDPHATIDESLRDPATGVDALVAASEEESPLTESLRPIILHFLAEAAIACARLDLAVGFIDQSGPLPESLFGRNHPYLTVMIVQRARILAFHGRISAAASLAQKAVETSEAPLCELFAKAAAALVHGNAAERQKARSLIELVDSSGLQPVNAISRGCYLLAAFGAVAIGEIPTATRLVLRADDNPALSRLTIIDRALSLELLIAQAVEANDLDAAQAWLSRLTPLEDHPIAASTVLRARSRVALLEGEPACAVELARLASDRALADGRNIERAEAEILLARARIALAEPGRAASELEELARISNENGHRAAIRSANRELRRIGRRLGPRASSRLEGLSAREREVARLIASGMSNDQIAQELYLSPHTVRSHVSRVLHAFGVATRIGVVSSFETAELDLPNLSPPALTPRQFEVAELIATGSSNAQIAANLGIGLKTVERHVTDILKRWRIDSRSAIATIMVSNRTRADSALNSN